MRGGTNDGESHLTQLDSDLGCPQLGLWSKVAAGWKYFEKDTPQLGLLLFYEWHWQAKTKVWPYAGNYIFSARAEICTRSTK